MIHIVRPPVDCEDMLHSDFLPFVSEYNMPPSDSDKKLRIGFIHPDLGIGKFTIALPLLVQSH